MRNRAKCKVCNSVLESFHTYDYVTCKCGEISISGGNDRLECSAKKWENFLRVDDEDNEIIVKVVDEKKPFAESREALINGVTSASYSANERIQELESMLKNIENLPQHVMSQPITHYDLYTYMLVVLSILKSQKN